jgi:hypothetical protein
VSEYSDQQLLAISSYYGPPSSALAAQLLAARRELVELRDENGKWRTAAGAFCGKHSDEKTIEEKMREAARDNVMSFANIGGPRPEVAARIAREHAEARAEALAKEVERLRAEIVESHDQIVEEWGSTYVDGANYDRAFLNGESICTCPHCKLHRKNHPPAKNG